MSRSLNTPNPQTDVTTVGSDNESSLISGKKRLGLTGLCCIAGSDRGINYKRENLGRVGISLQNRSFVVADGVGAGGDIAALSLARLLAHQPKYINFAVDRFRSGLKKLELLDAGSCFLATHFVDSSNGLVLKHAYAGNCSLLVIRGNKIVFKADQNSSLLASYKSGQISEDEMLYHPERSQVVNAITHERGEVHFGHDFLVESDDRVLIYSSGIGDNLTPREIIEIVRGLSLGRAFDAVAAKVTDRMEFCDAIKSETPVSVRKSSGLYSDGFHSMPRCANRSLIIVDVL